jgi:UDP-GlcNAc:undecaprenyl-phosphate GlcNAc-1-phosphate transferase
MIYLSAILLSLFITITLIPMFKRMAIRLHAMDVPDERKVHPRPMPKAGGAAMALGTLIPVILWAPASPFVRSLLIGAGIVVFFGLADDFLDIGYPVKFAGQVAAALVVILYGGMKIVSLGGLLPADASLPGWLSIGLTLIAVVGVTNAINLADGLDGLAGGISLLSFILISYLAYSVGNAAIALASFTVTGAIFGFLRFNTYPASLFMGDAGSQLLGFLAVTLSVGLTQGNMPYSPLLPLVLLGFPVLDTLTVMLERVAKGRSPFLPDKNHFHHKLMRLGLFHTEAVVVIYVLQAFLVISAFLFRFYSERFLLSFYVAFSGLILAGFFFADRRGWEFKRYDFVDVVIKGKLKILRDKAILIRVSFKCVEYGLPVLLILTCLLPEALPAYISWISAGLLVIIILSWFLKKEWLGNTLRLGLYLIAPFVVYFSESGTAFTEHGRAMDLYNLSFGLLVLFLLLTLKFTRRKQGFKVTPMDFLILFMALVLPNLPDAQIQSYHMGLLTAKIIVFFFGFEVMLEELRGEFGRITIAALAALMVTGIKGFIS